MVFPLVSARSLWDHSVVPTRGFAGSRWATLLLAAAAPVFGVLAYRVQVQNQSPHSWAAAQVVVGSTFMLAGLVAWLRRPANRVGPLMVAAGMAYLARQLRYSHDALLFTLFFLVGDMAYALAGHAILAYPSGKVGGRGARRLVRAGYATVVLFPLGVLLLHGARTPLVEMEPFPPRSRIALGDYGHAAQLVQKTEIVLLFGVLASLFIVVIVGRLRRSSPRARRVLAPLLLAAVALALRAVYECAHTFVNREPLAYPYLFWWQVAAFIALPLALLAGILRARLARANVSGLVVELERSPATPANVQTSLRNALADPELELFFWLPDGGRLVDTAGRTVAPPEAADDRATTRLESEGEPIGLLAYDASLTDEPELVRAAAAAARLALANARLHAEARAQLHEVRDSRRRIASAADEERRRIERNLHDGAQQRLLALALKLTAAREDSQADLSGLLASSVDELQGTIEELRTLARGLHPTVLVEFGLAGAFEAFVSRCPVATTVDVSDRRFPAEVESAAYFVGCEAMNNVVKHARATRASIAVRPVAGGLLLEVEDDGVGGAHPTDGSGLQGMRDRVEALGGRVQLDSQAGRGTRIVAEIPCAS
jgi:signal transduction histidine kinase